MQAHFTSGLDVLNRIRSLPNRSGKSVLTVIMTGPGGIKPWSCQRENQDIVPE